MEQLWIWQSCLNKHFHTRVPTSNISSMSSRSDIRIFFSWKKGYFSPKVRAFQAECLIEGMISYFQQYTFWGSPSHSEPRKEAETHEYSNVFTQRLRKNTPIQKNLTSGNGHHDEPHSVNRKLDVTACSIGEELGRGCVHRGFWTSWVASGKSFPVAGWREETGWHFRLQKKVFQGCFVVVVILVFVSSFVLKLSWCIRPLGTNIRHCLEEMRWQQDPLWFLMVTSWFVVGSLCTPVYPSPPEFQFNLENVSNQWWAPGWGLLEIQSL